jgi:ABC-type amino acid transport substrate-binding protein
VIPVLLALLLQAPAPAVLRVGLDPREAPAAFIPGGNYSYDEIRKPPLIGEEALTRVEGFDVDVMNALAQRLGVKTRVVATSWFDLEGGLLAGRYDVILGSWTPSEKTPKGIVASVPYYDWGLLVAVREQDASIRSLRELGGRRIGHIPDPSVERALAELEKEIGARSVLLRDGGALLFDDLRAGTIDALLFDSPYVRWRVAQEPRAFRIVGEPLNRLGYHVGLRSADASLLTRVNDAIRDFRESGEMARVQRRWEGGP